MLLNRDTAATFVLEDYFYNFRKPCFSFRNPFTTEIAASLLLLRVNRTLLVLVTHSPGRQTRRISCFKIRSQQRFQETRRAVCASTTAFSNLMLPRFRGAEIFPEHGQWESSFGIEEDFCHRDTTDRDVFVVLQKNLVTWCYTYLILSGRYDRIDSCLPKAPYLARYILHEKALRSR